jgi:hypothetical protein
MVGLRPAFSAHVSGFPAPGVTNICVSGPGTPGSHEANVGRTSDFLWRGHHVPPLCFYRKSCIFPAEVKGEADDWRSH